MRNNKLLQTPSQTIGPFFSYALTPDQSGFSIEPIANSNLIGGETAGKRISIKGRILDGEGEIVRDALIEIWQADAEGNYLPPSTLPTSETFTGFGRCDCENKGGFEFQTIRPGCVSDNQAPFINVIILMRGMLSHAYTRMYFSDETEANKKDIVLANIQEDRRQTIIANRNDIDDRVEYQFDIHMQGDNETVFFDV